MFRDRLVLPVLVSLFSLWSAPMIAQEIDQSMKLKIKLGAATYARADSIEGTIRVPRAAGGPWQITVRWTDCYRRVVAEKTLTFGAGDKTKTFAFPAKLALSIPNRMEAWLGAAELDATDFIVTPDHIPWDDYQVIMYYAYKPHQQLALRDVGITGGMNQGRGRLLDKTSERTKPWWGSGYRYYCEQILSDVYAEYHRHHSGQPKHIRLIEAKALYKKDRSKKDAFIRNPCFHDPAIKKKIETVMTDAVKINRKFAPFFYSLADEPGIADLPTAWDFCFHPRTLKAFREWLKGQYKTIGGLNAQWDTNYKTWNKVVPLTTDEMMARGDDNLSPWADHRTFMEITFAESAKWGVDAVLKEDPDALCGFVGCQMPSAFGGYDYWRLSQVTNIIEPYNIGNNREIWLSLAPEKVAITTAFGFSQWEVWRLWYQMLHGDKGIIIYDEKSRYLTPAGKPTPLGKKAGAIYKELEGGICKQVSHSTRTHDPVLIHYSHPSIHAHWMFDARPEGKDWLERGSASERLRSEFLRLRESFVKLNEDQQLQPKFIAYAQLERGDLAKSKAKLLHLPQSIAMSRKEVNAVKKFVEAGGTVIADSRLALMDQHCKRLPKGQLDKLFGIRRANQDWKPGKRGLKSSGARVKGLGSASRGLKLSTAEPGVQIDPASGAKALYVDGRGVPAVIVRDHGRGRTVYLNIDVTDYHRWRLAPPEGEQLRQLVSTLTRAAGVTPEYKVATAKGGHLNAVEIHPFENGKVKMIGIHRNPQLRVNELGPPKYRSNKQFQKPENIAIDLGERHVVYDVRAGKSLGTARRFKLKLDPYAPTILSLFPRAVKGIKVDAPKAAARGKAIRYKLSVDTTQPAKVHALRVDVTGPGGQALPLYSRNIAAARGKASGELILALSDPAGRYTISVRDVLTGSMAKATIKVD